MHILFACPSLYVVDSHNSLRWGSLWRWLVVLVCLLSVRSLLGYSYVPSTVNIYCRHIVVGDIVRCRWMRVALWSSCSRQGPSCSNMNSWRWSQRHSNRRLFTSSLIRFVTVIHSSFLQWISRDYSSNTFNSWKIVIVKIWLVLHYVVFVDEN